MPRLLIYLEPSDSLFREPAYNLYTTYDKLMECLHDTGYLLGDDDDGNTVAVHFTVVPEWKLLANSDVPEGPPDE